MSRIYKLERETLVDFHNVENKSFEQTVQDIGVKITKYTDRVLEFDLVNVDCSFANALRRILIGEVPTLAVKEIILRDNDSVFPDEFLAHRLGLVPLRADPEMFEFVDGDLTERNSLRFSLEVENSGRDVMNVYSDDIRWMPQGNQSSEVGEVGFEKGVLMFKLAPGQKINAELICTKNTGKTHAKWSGVCPATYRLMPLIEIGDVFDDDAYKLQSCFSKDVIEVREFDGRMKAYVRDARADSMSREALRHKEFEGKVFIGRVANHFLFTINSVFLDPLYLLKKALSIFVERSKALEEKVESVLEE